MANTLDTPTVLAFERKLDPSDALFRAGKWNDREHAEQWPAVGITEKSVRGTISNRLKTKDQDPAKLDAAIENPNPQTVDVATLPADADTLQVRFTLRVLAGTGTPSACNDAEYQKALLTTVGGYVQQHGFLPLARRYAYNIANGRFLWRNRVGAEQVEVTVRRLQQGNAAQTWTFDALALSLREAESAGTALDALSTLIAAGLAGSEHVLLEVTAFTRLGRGLEVYPSQELILDKGKDSKSKTLYAVGGVAGLHSQKVGNALRTIDTWYPNAEELGPIAAEPYGAVTTRGTAYRKPKADFYSLLDDWVLKGKAPETAGNQHFVISVLIRGGVFSKAGKKDS